MKTFEANFPDAGFFRVSTHEGIVSRLERLGEEKPEAPYCSPGFVDIQVNGFAGIDFSAPDLDVNALAAVLPAIWKTGVTSFCPTLITNSLDELERNLRVLESARAAVPGFADSTPCYHLEGPYLSPGPSHGAHKSALMRDPDWDEFRRLQTAAGENIGILTLAPERPGALDLIRQCRQSGVIAAISHTDGIVDDIHEAAKAGATLSTHLGNGCPQMIDRHSAPIWAQLAIDELHASIICDSFHVRPDLMKVIFRMKGTHRCLLVTDAVHAANLPPGLYSFAGGEIELLPSGQVVTRGGNSMAGSALSMDRAISWFMRLAEVSLADALPLATRTPAALLLRDSVPQEISVGAPANFAIFRMAPEGLQIERTVLRGKIVYETC